MFAFGAAHHGEPAAIGFCEPPAVVAIEPTVSGDGYWVQAADGNVFAFGTAPDHGSPRRSGLPRARSVAVVGS